MNKRDDEYRIIEDENDTQKINLLKRSVRRAFVVFKNDKSEAFTFEKYANVALFDGRYKYKEGRTGELAYRKGNGNVDLVIDDQGFHEILTYVVEENFAQGVSLNNLLSLAKTNMTSMVDNRYDVYPEIIIQRDDDDEFLLSARVVDDFLFRKVTVDVVDKVSCACLNDIRNDVDYSTALKTH